MKVIEESVVMNKKERKKNKFGKFILIGLIIFFVVIGIFIIKESFYKVDKSKSISEKILNIYLNSGK